MTEIQNTSPQPGESDSADGSALVSAPRVRPGDMVDDYELAELIGEGGLGVVFKAEQKKPVQRTVAMKVIRLGMDTEQVIARFETERQVLAMMDHPNVARVLDAGSTQHGRPYFVMEYVPGVAINDYCDRNRLPIRERLDLFLQVCRAIEHAHQKGVIHRDIKPSNALVTIHGDEAAVKVIDFGIAKAIHRRMSDQPLITEIGQLVGTPEYMSPEQADHTRLDVDTRSDIYSLGVLLYEVLTGRTPFDPTSLRDSGSDGFRKIIREVEPLKLSTRLSRLGTAAKDVAYNRRLPLSALKRRLRGELEWITGRAMEKDPSRRYATVGELIADIQRYLRNEPVVAGPPDIGYRVRKFAVRHRRSVLAGSIVSLAVLGGIIALVVGMVMTARAREHAEQEARRAGAALGFIGGILTSMDPRVTGENVTVEDVLDRAVRQIDVMFDNQPEMDAAIRGTIGTYYLQLGMIERAERQLTRSLELRERLWGPDHPETLDARHSVGVLARAQDDLRASATILGAVLRKRREVLGEVHAETISTMVELAETFKAQGEVTEAADLLSHAVELSEAVFGQQSWGTALNRLAYGACLMELERYAEADLQLMTAYAHLEEDLGREHDATQRAAAMIIELTERRGGQEGGGDSAPVEQRPGEEGV